VAEGAPGAGGHDWMQVWRALWSAVPEKLIHTTINGYILSRKGAYPSEAGDLHAMHGRHRLWVGALFLHVAYLNK